MGPGLTRFPPFFPERHEKRNWPSLAACPSCGVARTGKLRLRGGGTCALIRFQEVAAMKVFTSVFVLEGHPPKVLKAMRKRYGQIWLIRKLWVADLPRQQVVELQVTKESQQGRRGGQA
jgi:hypothetical protein